MWIKADSFNHYHSIVCPKFVCLRLRNYYLIIMYLTFHIILTESTFKLIFLGWSFTKIDYSVSIVKTATLDLHQFSNHCRRVDPIDNAFENGNPKYLAYTPH